MDKFVPGVSWLLYNFEIVQCVYVTITSFLMIQVKYCCIDCRSKLRLIKSDWDLMVYVGSFDEKSPFVYASFFVWWKIKYSFLWFFFSFLSQYFFNRYESEHIEHRQLFNVEINQINILTVISRLSMRRAICKEDMVFTYLRILRNPCSI